MNMLPALKPGKIVLALGASSLIPSLLAELTLRGSLTILDGGNRFPAYRIAHEIRLRSVDLHYHAKRIFLRRAFTCYQVIHLLESAPVTRDPYLILDLLTTFQDDQIQPREADRLLTQCFSHLERLSHSAPLAVCLDPFIVEDKAFLLKRLADCADEVFFAVEPHSPQMAQLPLFQA